MGFGHIAPRLAGIMAATVVGAGVLGALAVGPAQAHDCDTPFTISSVGGTGTLHQYAYRLGCDSPIDGTVRASWDATSRVAQEKIESPQGTVTAEWTCAFDPWVRLDGQQAFTCAQRSRTANLTTGGGTLNQMMAAAPTAYPYSAAVLTASERLELNHRLDQALKAKPTPQPTAKPTPSPAPVAGSLAGARPSADVSQALAPDLGVVLVGDREVHGGSTGTFTVMLVNSGRSAAEHVELLVEFDGDHLLAYDVLGTPSGFSCTEELLRIRCTGSLDAKGGSHAGVTFKLRGYGTAPGTSIVTATVDPAHRIDERTETNNTSRHTVTVK